MRSGKGPAARPPRHVPPVAVALRVVAALVLAWPLAASAYRPFDGTDAAVSDTGEVEIELGPLGYLVQGQDRSLVAPSLVLNWGFAERWEAVLEGRHLVELGNEAEASEPRPRIQDSALSLKHVLREGSLQRKAGISVATELGALLPTDEGERVGATWSLIASQRWPWLVVHVNGAAAWTRAHEPGVFGGIILEGNDARALRPVGEAFVEHERGEPTTVSGLLGAIWRASEALSLDAGVRRSRAGAVGSTELRLGLTWAFKVSR